ncbi:OmpA family protein [Plebeiibacterium sediminum]|uniref:OmpA family protein n=1 Tax=Plebeiibacterium sediminum TaxID=2992112 RepID=A0AAE3SF29_9BACT|nr:OmpA family protein [Plebeiobacterium sediminum]MCW3787035.1 OmpA family protein [Plebeiobacterium sediminum]
MKKITQYIVLSLFIFLGTISVQGQSKLVNKGDSYYKKAEYYQALQSYLEAQNEGEKLSGEVKVKMGKCYYELNNIERALTTLLEVEDQLSTKDDYMVYAQVYQRSGLYAKEDRGAIFWYEKALKAGANPVQVNELIESCNWAAAHEEIEPYRVNPSPIFTSGQSFGIQYYKNGVVYSSASEEGSKNVDRQGKSFLNLYYSDLKGNEIQKGSLFSKSLVSPYHIGAISFTSDFNTMYFTKVVRVKGGESRLKLFKVNYEGNDWGKEIELPFINDKYDYGHPAVSPDDKFLYFVSNMEGGQGGKDIYRVERLRGGMYGTVKNLGPEINTYGDEVFPFVSKDNVLYFSSDGHYGFGGLDIFRADYEDGAWKNVRNMLKPFNDVADDFAYVVNPKDPEQGFLSSSRTETGDDVIFTVEFVGEKDEPEVEPELPKEGDVIALEDLPEEQGPVQEDAKIDLSAYPAVFSAKVKSTFNNLAAKGVKVDIIDDATGKIIASGISDDKGVFNIDIPDEYRKDGQELELVFSKEGEFNSKRMILNIMELADLNENGLSLTPIFNDEVLDDISGMVLYYVGTELTEESKKTLDRLATYLQNNPQIVVKLNSHTDARGSKLDNLFTSQRMGEKVEEMLMKKGVDSEATIPRGYGERYIVNKCKRGVLCSDEEQLKNRRIEVVVWRVKK